MRLGLFGTFDVENYGDLLFPIIAEKELRGRLDDLQLVRYSYTPKTARAWPFEVRSLVDLFQDKRAIGQLDAILIGGGHLIRFDKLVAHQYEPPVAEISHPLGYWLAPALAGIGAGRPVLWNAPSASDELADWGQGLLEFALDNSAYVSVRDTSSLNTLRTAGYSGPCSVVPDTAFAVARHFPRERVHGRTRSLLSHGGVAEKYIVVQARPEMEPIMRAMLESGSLASDIDVLVLPIGPILGDDTAYLQNISPRVKYLPTWPTPAQIVGIIAV